MKNLKKIGAITAVLIIVVAMCFALTACNQPKDLEKFKNEFEKADSYEMIVKITDMPVFGNIECIYKEDGDKTYTSAIIAEEYTEIVDGKVYTYSKLMDSEDWIKDNGVPVDEYEQDPEESASFDADEFEVLFDSSKFEYSTKDKALKYIGSKDAIDSLEISNLFAKIEKGRCRFWGKAKSEGIIVGIEIIIKNLNKTTIELPEVTPAI